MTKEAPYFRPRNWHKFQSRSNNSMAWVKVYTNILSDPDYGALTENQKLTWLELLLLFGRTGRPLPLDSRWIGAQLLRDSRAIGRALPALELNGFIELCDRTAKLHNEVDAPREDKKREDKRRKKDPPLPPKGNVEIDDPIFENEFWPNHPRQRRGNKRQAWQAWKRALKRASAAEIMQGHRAYCESDEVKRGYAKGAAAWLNDDRWKHDYRTFRTKTAEEMREEFINGDERDDLGRGAIDGECMEVSERGSQSGSGGIPYRPAGSWGRAGNGSGNGPVVELAEGESTQAGGHPDNGQRVQDLIAKAAAATKAGTKP